MQKCFLLTSLNHKKSKNNEVLRTNFGWDWWAWLSDLWHLWKGSGFGCPSFKHDTWSCPMYTCPMYTCPMYNCPMYTCPMYTYPMYTCPMYTWSCPVYTYTYHSGSRLILERTTIGNRRLFFNPGPMQPLPLVSLYTHHPGSRPKSKTATTWQQFEQWAMHHIFGQPLLYVVCCREKSVWRYGSMHLTNPCFPLLQGEDAFDNMAVCFWPTLAFHCCRGKTRLTICQHACYFLSAAGGLRRLTPFRETWQMLWRSHARFSLLREKRWGTVDVHVAPGSWAQPAQGEKVPQVVPWRMLWRSHARFSLLREKRWGTVDVHLVLGHRT